MIHNFKSWQGWLLFGASMAVVFCLGLAVSALSERRAEVASIFNNRKNPMKGIVAQNEKFQGDSRENIRLGLKLPVQILKVNSTEMCRWMCWHSGRRW